MSMLIRSGWRSLALCVAFAGLGAPAWAGGRPPHRPPPPRDHVPEIDPGSAVGALTLLAGGALTLTDRRRAR